ncbi:hypothetical protein BC936DRAFT_148730 [Jimgerdemannia flammicorona]|uniref:Replication protein A subunit n=1 Tax=Jimgerdemannia flammicorona TaxID=994334 RepID=A0A433D2E8_9FUNG|nr:hypothetical protein BC936DRAFT_148730 [Jimgerdemannia flammicorona]
MSTPLFNPATQVYLITKARVTMARKQFSTLTNDYELTFETATEVTPCPDNDVPKIRYSFVPLGELVNIDKDANVDVIGIVTNDNGISSLIAKKTGKPVCISHVLDSRLKKRDITIVDQSHYAVKLTLWDRHAETFESIIDSIIAFKGVRVSDFGGECYLEWVCDWSCVVEIGCRSLSLSSGGTIVVDPDTPESHTLRGWYDTAGRTESFQTYSGFGDGSWDSSPDSNKRKTFAQVKDESLGMNEKPDYFVTKGTVIFFRQETISYPACKECKKKVIEEGTGWRCEKCQKTWPEPTHRYIMSISVSDPTGQVWMNAFDEVAEKLLGQTAGEMLMLRVSYLCHAVAPRQQRREVPRRVRRRHLQILHLQVPGQARDVQFPHPVHGTSPRVESPDVLLLRGSPDLDSEISGTARQNWLSRMKVDGVDAVGVALEPLH